MKQLFIPEAQRDIEAPVKPGLLTQGLLQQLNGGFSAQDPAHCSLLNQALDAVVDAETRIARQQERIRFLEGLSSTDELTGLFNRRGFMAQLGRILSSARRFGETGVLIVGDLDNFKRINDQYGHCAGDAVLRRFAETLRAQVRDIDVVARLGGDEFAVVLVQTSWRDASRRGRTLERLLNQATTKFQGHAIPIRASLGMEPYGPSDSEDELICRADMAMYCNKRKKDGESYRSAAE